MSSRVNNIVSYIHDIRLLEGKLEELYRKEVNITLGDLLTEIELNSNLAIEDINAYVDVLFYMNGNVSKEEMLANILKNDKLNVRLNIWDDKNLSLNYNIKCYLNYSSCEDLSYKLDTFPLHKDNVELTGLYLKDEISLDDINLSINFREILKEESKYHHPTDIFITSIINCYNKKNRVNKSYKKVKDVMPSI